MISFPHTLSKELCAELKAGRDPVLCLAEKPRNLLIFLKAAMQARRWIEDNKMLVESVVSAITNKVLIGLLPFDEATVVCDRIFKQSICEGVALGGEFFIVDSQECESYSRLVLMRASPVLRRIFYDNPDMSLVLLMQFATYLTGMVEFRLLYNLFVTDDYTALYIEETITLQHLIHQCHEWECESELDRLQKIMAERVLDCITASGELALSARKGLKLLEACCKTFLENAEFVASVHPKTGKTNYYYHDVILNTGMFDGLIYPNELARMGGQLVACGYSGSLPVRVECFNITTLREGWIAVARYPADLLTTVGPIQDLKRQGVAHPLRDADKLVALVSDGKFQLPNISVVGLLYYLKQVNTLELNFYSYISHDFLSRISEHKPDLETLGIGDYLGPFEELILYISAFMRNLKRIYFTKGVVSKISFKELLKLEKLKQLDLDSCKVELPEDLTPLNKLEVLMLHEIDSLSAFELQRLFHAMPRLQYLGIRRVKNFSLASILLPPLITELVINADQIDADALGKLENLKDLIIEGMPQGPTKEKLAEFIRNKNVRLTFKKVVRK